MSIEIPAKQKQVIENLLNRVKTMSSDEFRGMLDSFKKFHNYSFYNKCLIYSAGGSQVAGFNKWKDLKRYVVAKDKHQIGAITILAPSILHQVLVDGKWEKTTEYKFKQFNGPKRKFPVGFFGVQVFDIKDTDGEPLVEPMTKKSDISYSRVEEVAIKLGFTVEKRPMEFNLGGFISGKDITINSNRQESANVGTLIHEMSHGLLGHTDTQCDHGTDLKEVQAETVTYIVCQELGIERNSEFYLKAWGMSDNVMMEMATLSKVALKIINEVRGNAGRFIMED
jgi:hypothetical protein